MSTGEPRCSENEQVRFGGRPSEKGQYGTSLAAHPTSRRDLWEPGAKFPGHPTLVCGRPGKRRFTMAIRITDDTMTL